MINRNFFIAGITGHGLPAKSSGFLYLSKVNYQHLKEYFIFTCCWIVIGIAAGLYLLRSEAPYGRFSSYNWGPMISNKWGWFIMEFTVMVAFAFWIPFRQFNWRTPATVMIILFFIHYLHRSLIYPFMIRTKGKKMPVIIMVSAMLFNTVNGSLMGAWFAKFANYADSWYLSPPFIIGTILFIVGMAINLRADYYLIHLRKKGETGYKIPASGLFRLVSSPNLFGEIVEWGGYALLTWSLPGLAFFIWTCANLIPRAMANHRWYQKHFPEYPSDRKILLPFLW
jgi:3-oxo-5-alpha-steroid 4-dehydrogenase 1